MANLPSNIRGPKLSPFTEDFANAQFIKLLSPKDDCNSDEASHGRVFKVMIGKKKYAVKIFKFVPIEELRPFLPTEEPLINDITVRGQQDPFFAECRAFGLLVKEGKDDDLAVRCHGYVFLSKDVERLIQEKFGIHDWNRSAEDENEPLKAIVKDHIRFVNFVKPKTLAKMREKLERLNRMGIYNMDIRKENYRGGRLFDFSVAITLPHFSFSPDIRTEKQIQEDMKFDLKCFDSVAKDVNEERARIIHTNNKRWECLKSRHKKSRHRKSRHRKRTKATHRATKRPPISPPSSLPAN